MTAGGAYANWNLHNQEGVTYPAAPSSHHSLVMETIAVLLFAVAALGGATLAYFHFTGKNRPLPLGLVHGLAAATALVLLILVVMRAPEAGLGGVALGLFVVAALGGFVLLARHLRQQPWPSGLVLLHGGLAATAFVMLLVWVYGG